jgi:hypothetical protein
MTVHVHTVNLTHLGFTLSKMNHVNSLLNNSFFGQRYSITYRPNGTIGMDHYLIYILVFI